MKRKITVEVKNNKEAKAIELALQDKTFRATAIVAGLLYPFAPRARQRIMQFVVDKVTDTDDAVYGKREARE